MTQKIASNPSDSALARLPKLSLAEDEILGELYAVKAQLNREAKYDVSVLLAEARSDARRSRP